jgi:hypothetical protein
MAHSDAEAAALEPVRWQVNERIEILVPLVVDRLAPLDEEPTRHFLSAATKFLNAVVEERHAQEPEFLKYFRAVGPEGLYGEPE